jgi:GNAT superfamily N-acetyltransferase
MTKHRISLKEIKIKKGYMPGSIGKISLLHGTYYHENWGFGLFFEAKVAKELSEFLKRYDERKDCLLTAVFQKQIEGSVVIDGIHSENKGAHLRWFIVSDRIRGKGAGNQLIKKAVNFCREKDYKKIYLWTFKGLDAAQHLYLKHGFGLVEERRGSQWGKKVKEQRYELVLKE